MTVSEAIRLELARLPQDLRTSTLAAVAIDLGQRLDAGPNDKDATALSRELRLLFRGLSAGTRDAGGDDVERFLAAIANPALRQPGD